MTFQTQHRDIYFIDQNQNIDFSTLLLAETHNNDTKTRISQCVEIVEKRFNSLNDDHILREIQDVNLNEFDLAQTHHGVALLKIESGDTLSQIAKRFGVSVDEIDEANKGVNWAYENRDMIRVGGYLILPTYKDEFVPLNESVPEIEQEPYALTHTLTQSSTQFISNTPQPMNPYLTAGAHALVASSSSSFSPFSWQNQINYAPEGIVRYEQKASLGFGPVNLKVMKLPYDPRPYAFEFNMNFLGQGGGFKYYRPSIEIPPQPSRIAFFLRTGSDLGRLKIETPKYSFSEALNNSLGFWGRDRVNVRTPGAQIGFGDVYNLDFLIKGQLKTFVSYVQGLYSDTNAKGTLSNEAHLENVKQKGVEWLQKNGYNHVPPRILGLVATQAIWGHLSYSGLGALTRFGVNGALSQIPSSFPLLGSLSTNESTRVQVANASGLLAQNYFAFRNFELSKWAVGARTVFGFGALAYATDGLVDFAHEHISNYMVPESLQPYFSEHNLLYNQEDPQIEFAKDLVTTAVSASGYQYLRNVWTQQPYIFQSAYTLYTPQVVQSAINTTAQVVQNTASNIKNSVPSPAPLVESTKATINQVAQSPVVKTSTQTLQTVANSPTVQNAVRVVSLTASGLCQYLRTTGEAGVQSARSVFQYVMSNPVSVLSRLGVPALIVGGYSSEIYAFQNYPTTPRVLNYNEGQNGYNFLNQKISHEGSRTSVKTRANTTVAQDLISMAQLNEKEVAQLHWILRQVDYYLFQSHDNPDTMGFFNVLMLPQLQNVLKKQGVWQRIYNEVIEFAGSYLFPVRPVSGDSGNFADNQANIERGQKFWPEVNALRTLIAINFANYAPTQADAQILSQALGVDSLKNVKI